MKGINQWLSVCQAVIITLLPVEFGEECDSNWLKSDVDSKLKQENESESCFVSCTWTLCTRLYLYSNVEYTHTDTAPEISHYKKPSCR